jgi:hypothetical protein
MNQFLIVTVLAGISTSVMAQESPTSFELRTTKRSADQIASEAQLQKHRAQLEKIATAVSEKSAAKSSEMAEAARKLSLLQSTIQTNQTTLGVKSNEMRNAEQKLANAHIAMRKEMQANSKGATHLLILQSHNPKIAAAKGEKQTKKAELEAAITELTRNQTEAQEVEVLLAKASEAQQNNILNLVIAAQDLKAAGRNEEARVVQEKIDAALQKIPEGGLEKALFEQLVFARDAANAVAARIDSLVAENKDQGQIIMEQNKSVIALTDERDQAKAVAAEAHDHIKTLAVVLGVEIEEADGHIRISEKSMDAYLAEQQKTEEKLKELASTLGVKFDGTNSLSAELVEKMNESVNAQVQTNKNLMAELQKERDRAKRRSELLAARARAQELQDQSSRRFFGDELGFRGEEKEFYQSSPTKKVEAPVRSAIAPENTTTNNSSQQP